MARILVTGGAGFIGSNYVRRRLRDHPEDRLVVLDALTYAGHRENLHGLPDGADWRFVHADIRNADLVENLLVDERIDTVVHFAAESHVDRSILGPAEFLDVNARGTATLLEAARKVWTDGDGSDAPRRRFHHVSTDEVYGALAAGDPGFTEETPYSPRSPYAASKAASDHWARAYHHTFGMDVTISNCSNNYGPRQYPEKLLPLAILRLLGGGKVPVYGDGGNVRDWLHVDDHCSGIDAVLERGAAGRTYNIGADGERTNLEIVHELCDTVDAAFAGRPELRESYPEAWPVKGASCREAIEFVRDRPGHDWRYAIDATRIREELGWEPATPLSTGLADTVDWYLRNSAWCEVVTRGGYQDWVVSHYESDAS